jgi:methylated-DNA-[protein]-cysteine S-methyltransferase
MQHAISYAYRDSPVGRLLVAGDGTHLLRVAFPGRIGRARPEPCWRRDPEPLRETLRQLEEYFAGERLGFSLPLDFEGEPLQVAVWKAMRDIPYGQTLSYGEIARRIGQPQAARAVGAACGANPLPIVIPCHRVVGADGSLTGFGGGLPTKRFLLALEQRVAPQPGLQYSLFG